jgi:DNA repair protein RadC
MESDEKGNLLANLYTIPQIKLSYFPNISISKRPFIRGVKSAARILSSTWDKNTLELQETIRVMLLSKAHRVIGIYDSTIGNSTSCIADIRNIFAAALLANACAIVVGHNHPSGNLNPSRGDEDLCNKLMEGGKWLDIDILDFVITTRDRFLSFKAAGLMKEPVLCT